MSEPVVHALCQQVTPEYSSVESYLIDDDVVPDDLPASLLGAIDWKKAQRADPSLDSLVQCVSERQPWSQVSGNTPEMKCLLKEKSRLTVRNGLLYRERTIGDQDPPQKEYQLVVPAVHRKQILEIVHDKARHMGRERTLSLLRSLCYWLRITADVATHVRDCPRCLRRKHPVDQVAPLENMSTAQPMELVCIDYLTLESSKGGMRMFSWSQTISRNMHKHIRPGTRLHEPVPKLSSTTFLSIMASQRAYIATRALILRVKSSRSSVFLAVSVRAVPHHTTQWEMASANGLTGLWWRC